jgi:hypothetical protein
MPTGIDRTKGHYEVQEVDFGRVYRWCPERVDVECGGGRSDVSAVSAAAGPRRGANHAATIGAVPTAGSSEDRAFHPWRYDTGDIEGAGLPC